MRQENRVCHAVLEQIKQGAAKKAGLSSCHGTITEAALAQACVIKENKQCSEYLSFSGFSASERPRWYFNGRVDDLLLSASAAGSIAGCSGGAWQGSRTGPGMEHHILGRTGEAGTSDK